MTFPVTEKITALARLDYRSARGAAAGLSFEFDPNRTNQKAPRATQDLTPYASDEDPASAVVVTGAPATTSPHNQRNLTGGTNEDELRNRVRQRARGRPGPRRQSAFQPDPRGGDHRTPDLLHPGRQDQSKSHQSKPVADQRRPLSHPAQGHHFFRRRFLSESGCGPDQRPLLAAGFLPGGVHAQPEPGQQRVRGLLPAAFHHHTARPRADQPVLQRDGAPAGTRLRRAARPALEHGHQLFEREQRRLPAPHPSTRPVRCPTTTLSASTRFTSSPIRRLTSAG